ncbi:FtsX-like permease family protein [bacterium]|nr:FtsX-like permease family protein [bacterium]
MTDLKFAIRQLLRTPGFTAVAVLTLALGIGANTAIFSVINAVLLKPLPYHDPDRIMVVWADNPTFNLGIHELPPSQLDLVDWRQQASSFEQLAGFESTTIDLNRSGETTRVGAVAVTTNFFATIGMQPALGRSFSSEEEQPGKDKVVVVSDGLWQREFGRDPDLIGKSITLNNESRTVIGIMPSGFNFPRSAEMPAPYNLAARSDLWVPLARDAAFWQDDVNRQLIVIGRLKAGVSRSRAQGEMDAIAQRTAQERASTHTGWSTHLRPLAIQMAGKTRPVLCVLLGAVAFVLLIACANIASLLLCRSASRRKEMAIRAAIGAARGRVIRQLLTESALLALLGGGFGLLLGALGLKALLALSPSHVLRLHEASLNGPVLLFTLALSLATGVLFGLVPAFHASQINLSEVLNAAGRGSSYGGRRRSHVGLVTAEVAVAFTLLVGAALVIQSFQRLLALDPGFSKTGVSAFSVTFRGERYAKGEARIAFFHGVKEQLQNLPGVTDVAVISHLPLSGNENMSYFFIEGAEPPKPGHEPLAEHRIVSSDYFQTMGVSLVRGRTFGESDSQGKPLVAVVNETFAHTFFPAGDAIGKRIRLKDANENEWCQIVGIVHDVRAMALDINPTPGYYFAYSQFPNYWDEMTVVVRGLAAASPAATEDVLRHEMKAVDPAMPVANFQTIENLVSNAMAQPRFGSLVLGLFAATALLLTIVGLYGVVAYTVSQRFRELGIRVVLGARRNEINRMVLKQGMRPVLVGLALGLAAALGLSRLLSSLLFEINPADPATFLAAIVILISVTTLACWLPARRASLVDPMEALRNE